MNTLSLVELVTNFKLIQLHVTTVSAVLLFRFYPGVVKAEGSQFTPLVGHVK